MSVVVTDHQEQDRYEIHVDGELAGYSEYLARPGLLAFTHTEIEEQHKHRGLGEHLIAETLSDVCRRGLVVLPFCPFMRAFIQSHREYATLVPKDQWEHFEL
jgi:predicted GNAT family acetyltransferase